MIARTILLLIITSIMVDMWITVEMADEEEKGKWVWTKSSVLVPVPGKWCGISETTTSVSTSASDV